ncbi:MAG: hypothetical protein LIO46_00865, partial [Clostridiales bacterium]|nr:hypothetical protein [Clostridiales bacterium]
VDAQPGVFVNMVEYYVTNGSVWARPVEVSAYILTPFIMGLYGLGRRKKAPKKKLSPTEPAKTARIPENTQGRSFHIAALVTAAAVAFDLYLRLCQAGVSVVFYGTNLLQAWHLLTMYIIGVFFSFGQARKYLNLQVACIGVCLVIIFESSGAFLQYLLLLLVLPYAVFSFAFAPKAVFSRLGNKVELSYGIYLYGFFFQQLVISWQNKNGITLSYTKSLFLSAVSTLAAALLSFYLVEKPVQRLCRSILSKLKRKEEGRKLSPDEK